MLETHSEERETAPIQTKAITMTKSTATVSAREAYQVLKDVALDIRALQHPPTASNGETTVLKVDDWEITLLTSNGVLIGCPSCVAPDGRTGHWQRFGTDPVSLLSAWEQARIEATLPAAALGEDRLGTSAKA